MSNQYLFGKKLGTKPEDHSDFGRSLTAVQTEWNNLSGDTANRQKLASYTFATEAISETAQGELNDALGKFKQAMVNIAKEANIDVQASQREAGAVGGLLAGDINGFIRAQVNITPPTVMPKNTTFVGLEGLMDGAQSRISMEDYDEKDNRNVVINTIQYNFQAGRQNPFGELFFPTITVSNDNVGVAVSIRLVSVFEDFKHSVSGSLADLKKRNIVKAMLDHTILKNDMTKIVPVHRVASAASFVAPGIFTPAAISLEGEAITTAPLVVGKELNLIGLSQTDALLANGTMERTDQIDPAVSLDAVYVSVGDDVLKFRVGAIALSNFVASPQDNYRRQNLAFHTEGIMVNNLTKQADKSALVDLISVVNNNLVLHIGLDISGYVNIETGTIKVNGSEVKLLKVTDADTNLEIPLGTGQAAAVTTAFATAKIEGYDVNAYRTNMNRRQRGQLLDTTYYNQIWAVPLRSPLSVLRPPNADASTDAADLAALVSATFVRTSNEAVTTLLQTAEMLKEFVDNRISGNTAPDLFGVARFLIEPTFISSTVDVKAQINSISSHEINKDAAAVLVNRIRDIGFRLFRDSGYQAMVESQAAGVSTNPTFLIGTDPMTARYIFIEGDTRIGGADFEFKVETTSDLRMKNRIYIALGYPGGSDSNLNPVHFGNMLWSPEIVLVLPISRGGQHSKELTVQPRFRHIVNVPILGELLVQNLPETVQGKIAIDWNEV